MNVNLLEMLSNGSGKELIGLASKLLGENETNVTSGITKLIPVLLGGLINKASTAGGASEVFKMVTGSNIDAGIGNSLGNLLSAGPGSEDLIKTGTSLISSLFGADKVSGLTTALSGTSGVSPASSSGLLGMVAPLVFGGLKSVVNSKNLDSAGLANLLLGQKDHLKQVGLDNDLMGATGIPGGASMLDTLPASLAMPKMAAAGATAVAGAAGAAASTGGLMKWVPWLAAGVAAFIIWNLFSSKKPETPAPVATPAAEAPSTPAAPMTVEYPQHVYFATGSAEVDEAAKKVLTATADAITKDSNHVSITGYADKTGDEKVNEELAKNRAKSVKQALIDAGVKDDAIEMRPPVFLTGSSDDKEARRVDINRN